MKSSTTSLPMKVPPNILEWLEKHNPNLVDAFASEFQTSITRPISNINHPLLNTVSQPGTMSLIPITQNVKHAIASVPAPSRPSIPPVDTHQTTVNNILLTLSRS